jgi:guanylate kinase
MKKSLGCLNKGLIFVISAPAGTGKTTLVQMLCKEFDCVVKSTSYTTRKIRSGEVDGQDYHFISKEKFLSKVAAGEFLEHAEVFGNSYGTSKKEVESLQKQGKHVVLVIDTQGAAKLKEFLSAIFIFVSPPSSEELKRRLHGRQSETSEMIETRLSWAEKEMSEAAGYDYHIINENLKTAYEVLRSIFIAEEHRVVAD